MKFRPIIITFILQVFCYMNPVAAQVTTGSLEPLFSRGEGFLLEGPTMSPDGFLVFSDIPISNFSRNKAGIIWTLDPDTKTAAILRSPSGKANGMMFDANGDLLICEGADFGGRSVVRTNWTSGQSERIATLYNGLPFNSPNDLTLDEAGNIYFSDPRYFGHEPLFQKVMGIYRIDTLGNVERIIANASNPNGLAVSPDQKTLYVANYAIPGNFDLPTEKSIAIKQTIEGSVLAYDLLSGGQLKFREKLINLNQSGPDGMAIDRRGNLYIALGDRVGIYNPEGYLIEEIPMPVDRVTNVTFGRDNHDHTLFITAGNHLYAIKTLNEGYNIPWKTKP